MIYSNCRFTLDIQKLHSQVSIPVSLGDTAKSFYITLKDGGEPYYIETGVLAMLSIKRPSGTYLQAFCVIENNTVVKYDFSENDNTAIEEGLHDCEVTLLDSDGGKLSSSWFTMVVNARVINSDDINLTDEDKTAIDAMIAAEASRASAETGRVNAEASRVTAEAERVANDTARQTALDKAIAAVNAMGISVTRIVFVEILGSAWEGDASPYSQVVKIDGVTSNTKVDLQPTVEQLAIFHEKDLAFVTENVDGKVTVYAVGDKPTNDYNIQAALTEVTV